MRISDWSSDVCSSDLRPPLPPRRDDDLGIPAGAEPVAAILQFGAQLAEIIDFAVIGQRHHLVVARHRLRAARNVDDREAEVPETDAGRRPLARAVGPAMRHRVQHRADARRIDRLRRFEVIEACYTRSEEHTSELQSLMRISYA